jgi:N-acetylneuraminic acid mutarotase
MRTLLLIILVSITTLSQAGPWFQKADFGGSGRHRASSFSVGNMGYMGLGHINSAGALDYEDFWKYDPASNSWTQIADYPLGKIYHSTAFVIGDKAYVGTGRLTSGPYTNQFFEYDPLTNVWTAIANYPGLPRRGAVSFVVNGKAYVGTGQTNSGYVADFFEYNPVTDTWVSKAALPAPGRTSSVAFAIDNYGYLGTGNTNSGSINDFYRYDPVTNQWIVRAPVGPTNRQEATGFAVNGKGYIGTGDDYSSGNNFGDFWEYEPISNTWIEIQEFDGTARRYLSSMVIGDRAYCGTGTNGTNFNDFWMFDQILSVLERQMKDIQPAIYPNPSIEKLNIDLGQLPEYIDPSSLEMVLFDSFGRKINSAAFETEKLTIEVDSNKKGWYILQLNHEGNSFYTTKVLIQ